MRKGSKKKAMSLLLEYLKDSKRSDREIAKVLGVSQPTVTRRRQRLVKEGVIKEFTVIPDFIKMGYEIMAITCIKAKVSVEAIEKGEKSMMAKPNVIFAAGAQGMGMNGVMISMHKSYSDFSNFREEFLLEWGEGVEESDTIIISLKGRIVKPLSLAYLAEQEET